MQFLGGHIRLQTIGTAKLFTLSLQVELEFSLEARVACVFSPGQKPWRS